MDKYYRKSSIMFISAGIAFAAAYSAVAFSIHQATPTHYLLVSFYYVIIGLACSLSYHASLGINVRNQPQGSEGLAIGIPAAFFGLSAFFFSILCRLFMTPSTDHFDQVGDSIEAGGIEDGHAVLDIPAFLAFVGISGGAVLITAAFTLKARIIEPNLDAEDDQHPE